MHETLLALPCDVQRMVAAIKANPYEIWSGDGGDGSRRGGGSAMRAYVDMVNGVFIAVVTRMRMRAREEPVMRWPAQPRSTIETEIVEDLTEIAMETDYARMQEHLARILGTWAHRRVVREPTGRML